MQHEFWHERWANNQIGFHEDAVNPLLVAHFPALALPAGARVFLPLCGKTLDIDWLLSRGLRVAGAELSEIAVTALFERLGLDSTSTRVGEAERRSAPGVDVFVGDIFSLTAADLGPVDAVYDRAALIALPAPLRLRYAAHLARITGGAQLLVTVTYDQQQMAGPPFCVSDAEVRELYRGFAATELASQAVTGGLKGTPANETVWLLHKG